MKQLLYIFIMLLLPNISWAQFADDPAEPGNKYNLTLAVSPQEGGRVYGAGSYSKGTSVSVYAYANNHYTFSCWKNGDEVVSTSYSFKFVMPNTATTLTAVFTYDPSDPTEPGHSDKEFITITSQSELEAFANVEELPKSVRIIGTGITSLQSLSKLEKINGDLRIENTSLINLEGLDNLSTITGKLIVSGNRALVSMDGIYSWENIFFVMIEDNPELRDFCAMTEYAQKENPSGAIYGNAYNPSFEDIADGNCSKNEDVFKVTETSLSRGPNQIHLKLRFSNEPNSYSSLNDYVSFASDTEFLTLNSFSVSNLSYDLFFAAPNKEGEYIFTVNNTLEDTKGHLLNQNGNSYTGEDTDNYKEVFSFGGQELYVIAQAPLTGGVLGESSYTDLVFNDQVDHVPTSLLSMTAPSGKAISINTVEYIDSISPARYRVNYGELDEDGIYLFNLSPGLTSENGKCMSYQYQSVIEMPSANLVPVSITPVNEKWVAGENQSITYFVDNTGTKSVNGKCVDVIYLSSTNTWNSEAIELFRDTIDVDVDAQESYMKTVFVKVPTVVDGKYYLILKTNVTHSINELSYADNNLSADGLNISVEVLSDENNQFTLQRGESKIFRVKTESDINVEVIDNYGIANMYLGYYQLPDIGETPNQGSITILGADESVNYYLLISNNGKSQTIFQQCDLSVRNFELEVGDVGRSTIVKHGMAWIPVEVFGCTDVPTFYLLDSKGQKTECKQLSVKSETTFYAQFETESLETGLYSLYVESNGMTGLKQNAITITGEQAQPSITSKLVLPGTSRPGSTITAYIDCHNSGNVDIPAPLFVLSGTNGSIYELPSGETFTSEAHIIGVNESGVLSAFLPGESNRISINITIPNSDLSDANYKLKTITEGCDGIDEPFYLQWLDIDPNKTPSCYTDEEWSIYCDKLRNNVGDTWRTFITALGKIADIYYTDGSINYDANCLYSLLKEQNFIDSSGIQSKTKLPKLSGSQLYGEEEPGTIYIWKGGWQPLVEPKYDIEYEVDNSGAEKVRYIFRGWERTDHCSSLTSSRYFFISHGMNNNHNEPWIADMASALSGYGTVICVDWGRWAKSGWFIPTFSAGYVSEVSSRVHDALCIAFNNNSHANINMNQFHLIGHSHGAHVCGRLANSFNIRARRITALDASEELSHLSGSQLGTRWNASYIDYYKSSIICGTEYLAGDDNFILASGDATFTRTGVGQDISRHGYAYEWFIQTIRNNAEVGFNWYDNRSQHPKVTNHSGWSGVINGPKMKIEDYSEYADIQDWNYTSPWYVVKSNDKKASEWVFRTAIASTIDYKSNNLVYYGSKDYIQGGTTEYLEMDVKNNADNLTIPLDVRMNETNSHAVQTLFVSSSNSSNSFSIKKDKEEVSSISVTTDLYFLTQHGSYYDPEGKTTADGLENAFRFNFTSKLWKELGGTDEMEYMNCDFWIIAAADKSSDYKSSPTRSVRLWKGELYPSDNCLKVTLKVKNPNLSCEAGNDQIIKLRKGETTTNVSVRGTVLRDNGKTLSYYWEKDKSVFSTTMDGTIALGVGTYSLCFRIEAEVESNINARPSSTQSENMAEDFVTITIKPYTPGDEDDESTSIEASYDPNEKVGIKGVGGKSCVKPRETMEYTIYFENDAEKAQLAAQTVTVIDTLDTAFDLSTFEFTGAFAANKEIGIPKGLAEACIYTDMRPNIDLILKTDMKLDIDNRVITVIYSSLDTLTCEPTQDVFAGFLPPNDSTHIGEGHFAYRVKLKEDVEDGYEVTNQAHIFFDYNDEIPTNMTCHTIDCSAPFSWIEKTPPTTTEDSIAITWTGNDLGSGIKYYDIYCAKNGGEFILWKEKTFEKVAFIHGSPGEKYEFFSIATDSLGYVESMKAKAESVIEFMEPGGIEEVSLTSEDNISVYPRIVTNQFTISVSKTEGCSSIFYAIYDVSGRTYLNTKNVVNSDTFEKVVNCEYLPSGIYLVNVLTDDNKNATIKIIKK